MNRKIYKTTPLWKFVPPVFGAALFIFIFMALFALLIRPQTNQAPEKYSEAKVNQIIEQRKPLKEITNPPQVSLDIPEAQYDLSKNFQANNPTNTLAQVESAIEAGKAPYWYPRTESPIFAEMVKNGEIPPVAERIGGEPVVMRGCDGLGKYGGSWLRIASSPSDIWIIQDRLAYPRLMRWSPLGDPLVAHVAKSIEASDDKKEWTIKLRKVRWSDGHPLTADDLMYWWNYEVLDKSVGSGIPASFLVRGKTPVLEKIDQHTVKFIFPESFGGFLSFAMTNIEAKPKHFLEKYHPTTGDPKFLEAEMMSFDLKTARSLYWHIKDWSNPECPRLWPWIYREYKTTPPYVFVRNPYYFAVDEAGKQLPYIDRIQFDVIDAKMMMIAAGDGKVSMQNRFVTFKDYTGLMKRAQEGKIRLLHWESSASSGWMINPNLNRRIVEKDPSTKWKKELLADKKFRQALSLAINRKKIISALLNDITEPEQVAPGKLSEYYNPKLTKAFTEYDPKKASQFLDEIWRQAGADPDKRVKGYRCTPDGEDLIFYMDFCEFPGLGPADFITLDWAEVGIHCIYRERARSLFGATLTSLDFDFAIWGSESEGLILQSPRSFVASNNQSMFARGWGNWFNAGGLYNTERSKNPGNVPVPTNSPMYQVMKLYEEARYTVSQEKRLEYVKGITDIAAENLWTININSIPPPLIVADPDMKNIPPKAMHGYYYFTPGNAGFETYFFDNPSQDTQENTLKQLRNIVPLEKVNGVKSATSGILKYTIIAIIILVLILLCFRHPFVIRRLVIMVPTLLVISICIFTIIQLPPGDFLTSRILQLEESGQSAEVIETQIINLREKFHMDDPAWKRYMRWTGLYWFVSYEDNDKGLLQGNLGISMETGRNVNSMVGDRILLTFLISLGTVLFTWAIAIPIGIYSAVRKYSPGDYIFTLIGFLGMCIPSFLLALILSALTGISGLFSAKYAIQPFWDFDKVIDLLKHIWIPIVIMGFSGTAGMIRVMRANLLDELKKPYVVTARAKGVRPVKLLLKYPVRMALNPFISGIGGLFPMLISGSSIIAIVLSLPTVGPLMLTALFAQDMNMAGSMLMVLSLLGVFGTLFSDLLLMVVDPRIRLGGK